jgi:hemoglobin-like flavoprotein
VFPVFSVSSFRSCTLHLRGDTNIFFAAYETKLSTMGSATSIVGHHSTHVSLSMAVKLVLPLYFTDEPVTEEDLEIARQTWTLVQEDQTPAFLAAKEDPEFKEQSCLEWFFTVFYQRLFSVHPVCRALFKNDPRHQGRAMVNLITYLIQSKNDHDKVNHILVDLAHRHVHQHGVKAHEYAIFGEVLIHSLSLCIGKDVFTELVTKVWTKIYCMIIAVILPFHVKHEFDVFTATKVEAHPNGRSEKFPTSAGDDADASAAATAAVVAAAVM